MKKLFFSFVIATLLFGCGKDEEEKCAFIPEASEKLPVEIEQFEDSLVGIRSKKQLVDLLTRQPVMRNYMFGRPAYPNDSVFINEMFKRLNNPAMDTLLMETHRVFGDMADLKAKFSEAFTNIKYYYPDFVPPKVQTMITGLLDNDLFVSDSLIVVSLDYYLGTGAKYRPHTYEYRLRQYETANIVPSCLLIYGIGDRLNKTDLTDHTVLADMIAFGKAYYFAKHMLPCIPDSVFIWYTPEEIRGSRKNQDLIWSRFIQDQVLYSTSHMVKQKYLSERPKTLDVGPECPGRIGQWVGWQIVNAYAESHPAMALPEIMRVSNAQQFFKESGYRPERK